LDADTLCLRSVSGEIHQYVVSSVTPHKNIFLMKLEGVESIHDAEEFRDADILISKETLTREEGEFFWFELLGLDVYLDTGESIGSISQIISAGCNDVYVVKKETNETLIPATHEVVKDIDLENGKMIITAIEGLLDLNEV